MSDSRRKWKCFSSEISLPRSNWPTDANPKSHESLRVLNFFSSWLWNASREDDEAGRYSACSHLSSSPILLTSWVRGETRAESPSHDFVAEIHIHPRWALGLRVTLNLPLNGRESRAIWLTDRRWPKPMSHDETYTTFYQQVEAKTAIEHTRNILKYDHHGTLGSLPTLNLVHIRCSHCSMLPHLFSCILKLTDLFLPSFSKRSASQGWIHFGHPITNHSPAVRPPIFESQFHPFCPDALGCIDKCSGRQLAFISLPTGHKPLLVEGAWGVVCNDFQCIHELLSRLLSHACEISRRIEFAASAVLHITLPVRSFRVPVSHASPNRPRSISWIFNDINCCFGKVECEARHISPENLMGWFGDLNGVVTVVQRKNKFDQIVRMS